jgi:hypothetical protein
MACDRERDTTNSDPEMNDSEVCQDMAWKLTQNITCVTINIQDISHGNNSGAPLRLPMLAPVIHLWATIRGTSFPVTNSLSGAPFRNIGGVGKTHGREFKSP